MTDLKRIRQAIIEAIPYTTSNYGQTPDQRLIYAPPAHLKALRLESNLVIGSRGVGKSFWTAALDSPDLRAILGDSMRELEYTKVHIGFSVNAKLDAYPSAEVFADLLNNAFTPYEIWQAVVLRWLACVIDEKIPIESWRASTESVKTNPEPLAKLMQKANQHFLASDKKGLIVFDALDRSSNDWQIMDRIVRDLLRVTLWLRSYPLLHAKVFLREDQFERTVTDFPDASKLLATKAQLTWQPHDLHGLLWQLLCNAPDGHGETLRDIYAQGFGKPPIPRGDAWFLDDLAKREGLKQRALFEMLVGPWMGKGPKRGVPYVWSVSHLADGRGRTSPRSFLVAIRSTAEHSLEKYPDYARTLHYEIIKQNLQQASAIRVSEMAEDYPWIRRLFDPLRGLTVPCGFSVIEERWRENLPANLTDVPPNQLPPQHKEPGWTGFRTELGRLGIFEVMRDGRINMPDLYRVGFGLGRRGGVKPATRL